MNEQTDVKQLRSFGLTVGGVFLVIGLWPLVWRGEAIRLWAVIPAAGLIPAGLILPRVLAPLYKGWMAVGHVLGWINTRIILGILYYGLVVPMGLVMKMLGRDPMRRALVPGMDTYRVVREPRPPSHMKNMF
ncbi:MAG: SxtJ family membrane protein [Nitrospiraceae bacterium]